MEAIDVYPKYAFLFKHRIVLYLAPQQHCIHRNNCSIWVGERTENR